MTEKTANFALRLPPEFKAVAEALKDVSIYRPSRCGREGYVDAFRTGSINEALCSLILEGLEPTLGYVQKALDEETKEHAGWQEVMKLLLDNPTVDRARESDFAEGSSARERIEYWQDYSGSEENPIGEGIDRPHAARGYALSQNKLLELTTAKGAILNVLQPLEARAKETDEERHARYERGRVERKKELERQKAEREKEKAEREKARGPRLSVVASDTRH
jgi:hypothetical protein